MKLSVDMLYNDELFSVAEVHIKEVLKHFNTIDVDQSAIELIKQVASSTMGARDVVVEPNVEEPGTGNVAMGSMMMITLGNNGEDENCASNLVMKTASITEVVVDARDTPVLPPQDRTFYPRECIVEKTLSRFLGYQYIHAGGAAGAFRPGGWKGMRHQARRGKGDCKRDQSEERHKHECKGGEVACAIVADAGRCQYWSSCARQEGDADRRQEGE